MNQSVEHQRNVRDLIVFSQQKKLIESKDDWKRKYEEVMTHHQMLLRREELNCIEISALRQALSEAQADATKWQRRCCEIQSTTI